MKDHVFEAVVVPHVNCDMMSAVSGIGIVHDEPVSRPKLIEILEMIVLVREFSPAGALHRRIRNPRVYEAHVAG
jgi:hypothetical protein